ncbi:hypothetical protein DL96DRAFT_1564800 [Flagelloscypha sp. PMI_526]|nr:hypothetical protein DL96DRAFT_1564800 [Flagelloscypha sp. PMI_526]
MFDAQLILHLVELVGDRLDAFCIQSVDDFGWDQFPDSFISLIAVKVLPHIHSLELIRIMRIPLLATLRHCTHLQTVRLGAMSYLIAPSEGDGHDKETLEFGIPLVSSLVVDVFGKEDFGDDREGPTSLKRLILLVGASICSLTLSWCCDPQFPFEWDFLHPFRDLRHSLLHLSFGTHLYETIRQLVSFPILFFHLFLNYAIVDHMTEPDIKHQTKLDFGIFSHLQSITFSIPKGASPAGWELFSICFAQSLNCSPRTPLITLNFVLHSIYYPEHASSTSLLDNLVQNGNFDIHVVARGGLDGHGFADITEAFRMDLPSWDDAGKLKFWFGE